MFHACAVNTANIAAHSRPSWEWGKTATKNVTVTARKPRTGTDWRMSSAGTSTRRHLRLRAAT